MTSENELVGSTADGLVIIRSGQQARALGVEDPFAKWFITDEGDMLLQLGKNTDTVYEEYNLARYKFTTSKLRALSRDYHQMLFLGSGFDCRPIWLDVFEDGETTVFEIDEASKLKQKRKQLGLHGVSVPEWNPYIPSNLENDNIPGLLFSKGLNPDQPLLILAEGLFFFVPTDIVKRALDPKWLDLASGSRIIFDCWSDDRVNALNPRVLESVGHNLFHPFPYHTEPEKLKEDLVDLGYRHVTVTPVSHLAETYYNQAVFDGYKAGWIVVEATI